MNHSDVLTRSAKGALLFFLLFMGGLAQGRVDDWAAPLKDAQQAIAEQRYSDAYPVFALHAKQENGLAQFTLGLFYELGWGRQPDRHTACTWFEKAARNNIPASLSAAADCILDGNTEGADPQQAFKFYMMAFEQNLFSAGCTAGMLLIGGKLGPDRAQEGVQLCIQAAEKGATDAALRVAKWHFYGEHVKQNLPYALDMFQRARPDIEPEAAFYIARFFDEGLQIQQDNQQAAHWYEVAAEKGWKKAYLPCAALYWANFQSAADHRDVFLAKAYMWGKASATVEQQPNLEDAKRLMTAIQQVMPENWTDPLDRKVHAHLHKFTSPETPTD